MTGMEQARGGHGAGGGGIYKLLRFCIGCTVTFPSGELFLSSSFNLLNPKEKNVSSALGMYAFLFPSDFLLQQTFILSIL